MLREYKRFLDGLHVAATGCAIVAVYVVLHGVMRDRPAALRPLHEYLPAIGIFTVAVMSSLARKKFSALSALARPHTLLRDLAWSYGFGMFAYAFAAYAFKIPHFSRLYLFGGMAWGYAAAAGWHLASYALYRAMHARGWNVKRALLVGDESSLPELERSIRSHRGLGLEIAGVCRLGEAGLDSEGMRRLLDSTVADYAIFSAYRRAPGPAEELMLACQERGIEIWLRPDFIHQEVVFSRFDYLADIPMFVFSQTPQDSLGLLGKRLFDLLAAAALLVLGAVPMALIAAAIRLTSRGPALFAQPRLGLNGRSFLMLKFRSMFQGEEPPGPLRNELKGPVFKMADDPRVTPVGKLLRRHSLDELPQLWNVLMGDMSLVGPRPPLPSEAHEYEGWQRRRLSMRPGITGLWQVGGRNALTDFNDWVELDLKYIDTWSLGLDLKILLMTIPAVVKGTGL